MITTSYYLRVYNKDSRKTHECAFSSATARALFMIALPPQFIQIAEWLGN